MKFPRFRTLILIASAGLFGVVAALALKSYVQGDYLAWARTKEHHVESVRGNIHYWTTVKRLWHPGGGPDTYFPPKWVKGGVSESLPPWPRWTHASQRNWGFSDDGLRSYLGVAYGTRVELGSTAISEFSTHLVIPYWLPLAVAGLPWGIWGVGRLLRRHARPGLCRKCSYDLRAHKVGEKCPECGTVVSAERELGA